MIPTEFLPPLPGLDVRALDVSADGITLHAVLTATTAVCPNCRIASARVHSRYVRTLADKPLGGRQLRLCITTRRFACDSPACPRAVFAEPLDGIAPARARTTADLADAHTAIGFAAGGEPGSRLAHALDLPTSPDTLLRRVRAAALSPAPPPRYVGIDDWAVRKGQNYGTIVVDLERGRVVALLPGRDGEALADWLRANPQVEVITRDRWPAYAKAAADAAPQATQVADRWHLLKNLREAVEDLLARMTPDIRAAAGSAPTAATSPPVVPNPPDLTVPPPPPVPSAREAKRQAKRDRRQRVRDRKADGWSIRQIAAHFRMSVKTVVRTLRTPDRPHANLGRRGPTAVDAYRGDVEAWLAAGGTNTADLYRVLTGKGCRASYDAVRRYANRRLGSSGTPGRRSLAPPKPAAPEVPSARNLSFQFACPKPPAEGSGPSFLDRVRGVVPGLDAALALAAELADMIRRTVATPLAEWIAKAVTSGIPELARFAVGLQADAAAVTAALTMPWSNGQVEGQVNRLKAIKRSMFGRAGLDLLRARVLRKD